MMNEKKCNRCHQVKGIESFSKAKRWKDGRNYYCRECMSKSAKKYFVKNREKVLTRQKEYHTENRDRLLMHMREYAKGYYKEHREEIRKHQQERKLKALQKVSGQERPICVGCGCDDIRLLQINHINGGGSQEQKEVGSNFYARIVNGSRTVDGLNILCRPCDGVHYLRMKYGNIPIKVVWKGGRE